MARTNLIIDNDFGGDPDGLFQLAHHLLSPSANILGVVNSHVMPGDPNWPTFPDSITKGFADIEPILEMTGVRPAVFGGLREDAIDHNRLIKDETLDFLISSVETTTQTLVYACGGPMTQLARLVNAKPKNLEALRVLWIGGSEFSGVYPPGASSLEYNLAADPESVQIVFNSKELELWHIPRDSYRRAVLSFAELNARLADGNPLQLHLLSTIKAVRQKTLENSIDIGETYCFGDSPLVLLSVLENSFEPTPAGSEYFVGARHSVNLDGSYGEILEGTENKTRVFSHLDTRLMFEDMFAKLGGHSGAL